MERSSPPTTAGRRQIRRNAVVAISIMAVLAVLGAGPARADQAGGAPPPPAGPTRQPTGATKAAAGGPQQGVQVVRNADGRLEAFRSVSGTLQHTFQRVPNGPWVPWELLTGVTDADPVAVLNADGRVEVFVRSPTLGAAHAWQERPGGPFSPLASLSGGRPVANSPAVTRNADGRLETFFQECTGSGGACGVELVLHTWQEWSGGPWSSPVPLDPTATFFAPITAFTNVDGSVEVCMASGPGLFATKRTRDGWSSSTPAAAPGVPSYHRPMAVTINADGRAEMFASTSGDGFGLWHRWQVRAAGPWGQWTRLADAAGDSVAAARNRDGRLEVFSAARPADTPFHVWQTTPGGGWSEPATIPAPNSATDAVALAANADGRLEAFYGYAGRGGPSPDLSHSWQEGPGIGPWAPPVTLP